jgi:hypothetical protein
MAIITIKLDIEDNENPTHKDVINRLKFLIPDCYIDYEVENMTERYNVVEGKRWGEE